MTTIQLPPVSNQDINIEFVYDASGSMGETVKDSKGKSQKKYIVANNALLSAATIIQGFSVTTNRNINCGMWMLRGGSPVKVFDIDRFNINRFNSFCKNFDEPSGNTPLGLTIDGAACDILRKRTFKNYIVVISDGESNSGRDPHESIVEKTNFANNEANLKFFFIAFDVNSSAFKSIKKLSNVDVFEAADETQLTERLSFIVEKKILLENE
jgi:hypothetical protein